MISTSTIQTGDYRKYVSGAWPGPSSLLVTSDVRQLITDILHA
jgi:hypothetical protein